MITLLFSSQACAVFEVHTSLVSLAGESNEGAWFSPALSHIDITKLYFFFKKKLTILLNEEPLPPSHGTSPPPPAAHPDTGLHFCPELPKHPANRRRCPTPKRPQSHCARSPMTGVAAGIQSRLCPTHGDAATGVDQEPGSGARKAKSHF